MQLAITFNDTDRPAQVPVYAAANRRFHVVLTVIRAEKALFLATELLHWRIA